MLDVTRPCAALLLCGLAFGGAPAAAQAPGPAAVAGQAPAASTTLELPRAVTLAVQSHPSIGAALAALAQQGSAVEAARAGYRPQIQAGMASGRQADGRNGQQLVLSASQMLYDFGKVDSAVGRAEAGQRQSRAQLLLQVDDIMRDTALAAIEVGRYQRLKAQGEALVAALHDIVKLTELRAAAGATSRVDPITARARFEAAGAGLLNIESQRRQQRSKLQMLISAALPERVEPPDEAWWTQALGLAGPDIFGLPALQQAQAELEASRSQLDNARAQQMPTVTLDAGVNRRIGGAVGGLPATNSSLMVNVSSSLYQGGSQTAQVEAAAHAVAAAQARLDSTRLDWLERQQRFGEQAASLGEQLRALASRQQVLQGTRGLYREQYLSLGTRSALDLLNVEQEISQAVNDRINAQHDLWAARFQALYARGQLREVFAPGRVQGRTLE